MSSQLLSIGTQILYFWKNKLKLNTTNKLDNCVGSLRLLCTSTHSITQEAEGGVIERVKQRS